MVFYVVAWANVYTAPIKLHGYSQIESYMVDRDLVGADPPGVCTLQGIATVAAPGCMKATPAQKEKGK